ERTVDVSIYVDPLDVPARISFGFPGKPAVTWTRGDKGLSRGGKDPIKPGTWNKIAIPAADFGLKPGDRIGGVSLSQAGGIVLWDAASISGQTEPTKDPLESLR